MTDDLPAVPSALFLRLLAAALSERSRHLRERSRRGKDGRAAGRLDLASQIERELADLEALATSHTPCSVAADVAGLLAAYALGDLEARRQLAEVLEDDGRVGAAATVRGQPDPVVMARAILG